MDRNKLVLLIVLISALAQSQDVAAPVRLPIALFDCGADDNIICSSALDGSGNPAFMTAGSGLTLNVLGATTNLKMYIAGKAQTLATDITVTTVTTATNFILAKQDTTNATMVAGDFVATTNPVLFQYATPTCPANAGAQNSWWFDYTVYKMKACTANSGSYSASPAIPIGVVVVTVTPTIVGIGHEPFRLDPMLRITAFGQGADGQLALTSGTTTKDGLFEYNSFTMTAATLNQTQWTTSAPSPGILLYSLTPVVITNGSAVTVIGLGRTAPGASTAAGTIGNQFGCGGAGGGGGGAGATNLGGAGGNHFTASSFFSSMGGGTAGAVAGAGGTGQAATVTGKPDLQRAGQVFYCGGSSGGGGGGDGGNGGVGGTGGSIVVIHAPSVVVTATGTNSIKADGGAGAQGAGTNVGGGGGGGGGSVIIYAGFITNSGTISAVGGAAGALKGTGGAGGVGGAGFTQLIKAW